MAEAKKSITDANGDLSKPDGFGNEENGESEGEDAECSSGTTESGLADDHSNSRGKRCSPGEFLPLALRKEIINSAMQYRRGFPEAFKNPQGKLAAARLLRSLLPPAPRRPGRPADQNVTRAIRLRAEVQKEHSDWSPPKVWALIYPQCIDDFDKLAPPERSNRGRKLREDVRSRLRKIRQRGAT